MSKTALRHVRFLITKYSISTVGRKKYINVRLEKSKLFFRSDHKFVCDVIVDISY